MRIATSHLYDAGIRTVQQNQSDLFKLQNQISTGRRIVSPEDDPVAASEALITTHSKGVASEYKSNQDTTRNNLQLLEGRLGGLTDLLQNVKDRWVEAGNSALTDGERKMLAGDLRQRFDEMMGIANSADATGVYLFSGYQGNTQPYSGSVAGGVTYAGDQGRRVLQVEAGRLMENSVPGSDVFAGTGARDLFTTLGDMITQLETPIATNPAFSTTMDALGRELDGHLDNVMAVRTQVGTNLNELDALTAVNEDVSAQYEDRLAQLQELDYAKAISDLAKEQLQLQASQQSFTKVTKLSLFDML